VTEAPAAKLRFIKGRSAGGEPGFYKPRLRRCEPLLLSTLNLEPLANQHTVAVAEEAVFLGDGFSVGFQNEVAAGKGSD